MLHVGVSILSYSGQHHGWKVPLLQLLRQILGPKALGLGDSASKFHGGRLGLHAGIPVRWLPGHSRGPPLKVQLDPRQMFQGGAGHARVHAPVLLPNSGNVCASVNMRT